jgi:hypothetical protein
VSFPTVTDLVRPRIVRESDRVLPKEDPVIAAIIRGTATVVRGDDDTCAARFLAWAGVLDPR